MVSQAFCPERAKMIDEKFGPQHLFKKNIEKIQNIYD